MMRAVSLLALGLSLLGCARDTKAAFEGVDGEVCSLEGSRESGSQWWMLIHPSNAPDGAGIVLYDERSQRVECRIAVHSGLRSPHALSFDGKRLWVGGHAT